MPDIHKIVGFAVVGVFTVGWVWGLGAKLVRRGPGERYWIWLTIAQIVAVLQAVLGTLLLLTGYRLNTGGALGGVLHYVYGYLPLLLFVFAHMVARQGNAAMLGFDPEKPIAPWVPFAWAGFICFGLTLRALMTGLAVG